MMNYKETLFFIGKCLTISYEEHNFSIVEKQIKSDQINWDNVVKVATAHYVFPALYCNLKRKNLTQHLPKELVAYMKHITDLNRERNTQIIEQAKEINELLLANNIKAVFLKGTSYLLQGLYEDIAERMVGDIDFLVQKNQYQKTINLLKNNLYKTNVKDKHIIFKSIHYPKMVKDGAICAIEIHHKIILSKYSNYYNYKLFYKNHRVIQNIHIPSNDNQILHNVINKQFSDRGRFYKSVSLRNCYDLFKLATIKNPLESINNNPYHLNNFNSYLGITSKVFNSYLISYNKTLKDRIKISEIYFFLNFPSISNLNKFLIKNYFKYKSRVVLIFTSVYKTSHRNYLIDKLLKRK